MENTYWDCRGKYQALSDRLNNLVPIKGAVVGSKNRQLERFRKAGNAYYDIFNNGGMNRSGSIRGFFGFGMSSMRDGFGSYNWNKIYSVVEPKMDEIILAAAVEQGMI